MQADLKFKRVNEGALQSNANKHPLQRRITLIRHAKAEEGDGADIGRPLNARGARDAATLGQWLQAENAFPQLFLCSTAQRTRQTLAAFGVNIATMLSERLYLAGAGEVMKLLGEMDDAVTHIAIIGHNPGIHQLAAMLVRDYASDADAERLALKFPTAACAILDMPLPRWRDIAAQSAKLEMFVTQSH